MKIETIYGVPVASGMGNAFDALENINEIEDAAQKLIAAIARYDNSDEWSPQVIESAPHG